MTTPDPTPAPQTIAQVCGTTEEARQEHLKRPVPDEYAGLSKQEVAERLKNPTPDATATPRTDAALKSRNHLPEWYDDVVSADFARTLERELTAAKAEICELNAWKTGKKGIEDHYREVGELQAGNAQLRAEVERLKADNESLRTLWTEIRTVLIQSRTANCVCSYGAQQADAVEAANAVLKRMPPDVTTERDQLRARAETAEAESAQLRAELGYRDQTISRINAESIEQDINRAKLRAEVERLKQTYIEDGKLIISHGHTIDQLRARVAELEQDKARLAELLQPRINDWQKDREGDCTFGAWRMEQIEEVLAARAGKEPS